MVIDKKGAGNVEEKRNMDVKNRKGIGKVKDRKRVGNVKDRK